MFKNRSVGEGKPLEAWHKFNARQLQWSSFQGFLLQAKTHLQGSYAQAKKTVKVVDNNLPNAAGGLSLDPSLEKVKQRALAQIHRCYAFNRKKLGAGRFDEIMQNLNNAYLVSIGTYADLMPAFAQLFVENEQNWSSFFQAVEDLAQQPMDERQANMSRLAEQYVGQYGNNHDAHQIDCQSFFSHGLN